MATIHDSYLGIADETTYGTAVAPNRFYELLSEGVNGVYERVTSEALRKGQKAVSKDRFVVNPKGAEGDVELEVLDTGFGILLKHMMGSIATAGIASPYTHTATVGDLTGKSFTMQVGRAGTDGAVVPFTYEGGKVTEWELSNEVDGILMLKTDLDFEKETIGAGAGAYALATPTYPAGGQLFTFGSGTFTIGGTSVALSDITVKAKNGLKTDRYVLGTTSKREPLEEGAREYEFEVKGDFEGVTQANRVASASASGALAAIDATWTTPGGFAFGLSIPNARFDEFEVNFDGGDLIEQSLKGIGLTDSANVSPITLTYTTADATP
jgi:hypothetical protein